MNPGAPTRSECLDLLRALVFRQANPRQPADPNLEFKVDLRLWRRPMQQVAA